MDKRKLVAEASDVTTGHLRNSNLQTDGEDQESSTVIIGYCPDMCPGVLLFLIVKANFIKTFLEAPTNLHFLHA